VSGTQITFTTAPASSDTCFIIAFGEKLDIGTPSDATVTSAKLASTVLTGATDIGAGIADADLFLVDDGAGGTLRKTAASRIKTYAGTDLTAIADGSVGSPSLANSGDTDTGIYFPAANTVGVTAGGTEQFRFGSNPIPGGSKNMLINGAMRVSQRGTSFTSFGATDSEYGVDRWKIRSISSASARWTASQESSGGVSGKDKWLKVLNTTADASPGVSETQWMIQQIEGFNAIPVIATDASTKSMSVSLDIIAHADGGSSISFPAKACVTIEMGQGSTRSYLHDVTIAAADTWERVTFTAPADSFNGWVVGTEANLGIGITLYGGSNRVGTEDTWAAIARDTVTSNTDNWADATNNYIGFTNVQVEVGSVATDFSYEDYGTTLFKCKRYYQRITFGANGQVVGAGENESTTQVAYVLNSKVAQRSEPTFGYSSLAHFSHVSGTSSDTPNNLIGMGDGTGDETGGVNSIVSTGNSLNSAGSGYILTSTSTSAYLDYSAEL